MTKLRLYTNDKPIRNKGPKPDLGPLKGWSVWLVVWFAICLVGFWLAFRVLGT